MEGVESNFGQAIKDIDAIFQMGHEKCCSDPETHHAECGSSF